MCPVFLACSWASFSPLSPSWHTAHLKVKFVVSVNCLASFSFEQRSSFYFFFPFLPLPLGLLAA